MFQDCAVLKVQKGKTKGVAAIVAILGFLSFGSANAQDVLDGSAIEPDHDAIRASKVPSPGNLLMPVEPMTPDPMISTLPPHAKSDPDYWKQMRRNQVKARLEGRAQGRAQLRSSTATQASSGVIEYSERESDLGDNDSIDSAERIRRLKSGKPGRETAIISGSLGELPVRDVAQVEDDGSIPLALQSGISGGPDGVRFSGVIGDSPQPGVVSDYDFVEVTIPAGATFDVAVRTDDPFGDLDPFLSFYLADGTLIFQQDDGGDGFDSFATLTVGAADLQLFIAIGGFGAFEPFDPFNSSGGSATGLIGSEGAYEFELRVFPPVADVDVFSLQLRKGDVFGAAARIPGAPSLRIFNKNGELEKGVTGFGSFGVEQSPLPVDGSGAIDYVVEKTGTYYVELTGGIGPYELELGLFEPEFKRNPRRIQLIWLDFNGGPVSKEPWFGFPLVTDHTPFRDFLPAWGLPNADDDVRRITRKITREVRDNLKYELLRSRVNPQFGAVVLGNDGTGIPSGIEPLIEQGSFTIFGTTFEVSVLEVSGTVNEAFINTIGIASTIDPGNYAVNDAALVLLDTLSAPASGFSANSTFSLNDVVLAPHVSKEKLVTTVVGNVTAHEAGHYLGNFHTDGVFSANQGIMDEGPGGLFNLAGIGPSGVFGAEDQTDVSFIDDDYSVLEGFVGEENTTINTAFGLSYLRGFFGGYRMHED